MPLLWQDNDDGDGEKTAWSPGPPPDRKLQCHYKGFSYSSLFKGGFSGGSVVKNSPASAGLISGSRKPPGIGNGNPLQYSCLRNPMDRGTWRATSMGSQRVGYDRAHTHSYLPVLIAFNSLVTELSSQRHIFIISIIIILPRVFCCKISLHIRQCLP